MSISTAHRGHRRTPVRAGVTLLVAGCLGGWATLPVTEAGAAVSRHPAAHARPLAPPGFAAQVEAVYQSEFTTAQALGSTQDLEPVASYEQRISQMGSGELGAFYDAVQHDPQFFQIPADMQAIAADYPGAGAPASAPAAAHRQAQGTVPTPFTPTGCDTPAPEAALFVAQVVVDTTSSLFSFLTAVGYITIEGLNNIPALAVAAGLGPVIGAASIVRDALAFSQVGPAECQAKNIAGYAGNIDSTTSAEYALDTSAATALAAIESVQASNGTGLSKLETGVATLNSADAQMQQQLGTDTQSLQSQTGQDVAGTLTDIQALQSALQQDAQQLTKTESATQAQVLKGWTQALTSVEGSVASSTSQLVAALNTHTLTLDDALKNGFSAAQQASNSALTLQIEQVLATAGPTGQVTDVEMALPAAAHGYLDSTPVGVQEVVHADYNAAVQLHLPMSSAVAADLAAGDQALANHDDLTAYQDYAQAYQGFA